MLLQGSNRACANLENTSLDSQLEFGTGGPQKMLKLSEWPTNIFMIILAMERVARGVEPIS